MPHYNKQNSIEKVVRNSLKLSGARNIIVALSGGADSVALLAALAEIRTPLPPSGEKAALTQSLSPSYNQNIVITAAHCNFHLRGEESMRDQHFVESLCTHLHIPLEIRHFDVAGYRSLNPSVSIEMACRDLRYDWFRRLMIELKADRIATGHNADDNIETMFLNLLRGSGTTGLRGMSPDNGSVLRPLLSIHRPEIEKYLKGKGLDFIVDSSNLTSDYRRNFLRNEIIPQLRMRWPGLNKALDRSIQLLKAENDIIEKAVADCLPPEGMPLSADVALSFPAPELLIRRFIQRLQPLTTTPGEIVAAMRAAKSDVRRWALPGGSIILRAGRLYLYPD